MKKKPVSGFQRVLFPLGIWLCFVTMPNFPLFAQQPLTLPSYYAELNIGAQSHFGPYERQAEISGGYDSTSFDHANHYKPGFKTTVPVELVFGFYRPRGFRLESRLGYFQQDMGLIKLISEEEFHLAFVNTLSFNISTLIFLSNAPEKIPFGFFAGFSAGVFYPLKFSLDQDVRNQMGIASIEPHLQLHLSLEGMWNVKITKSGFYFTLKLASDLPSMLVGSLGSVRMADNAAYTVNNHNIKMYSFRISGGIGYTLRR